MTDGCFRGRNTLINIGFSEYYSLMRKTGGEGSRTPVLKAIYTTFYMLIRSLILGSCCEPSRHQPQSGHEIDSLPAAATPAEN